MSEREFKPGIQKTKRRDERMESLRKKRSNNLDKRRGRAIPQDATEPSLSIDQLIRNFKQIPFSPDTLQSYIGALYRVMHKLNSEHDDLEHVFGIVFDNPEQFNFIISLMLSQPNIFILQQLSFIIYKLSTNTRHSQGVDEWSNRLMGADIIPVILHHIGNNTDPIIVDNMWSLMGNLCISDVKFRDLLIHQGALELLCKSLNSQHVAEACWVFYAMCKKSPTPPVNIIQPVYDAMLQVLQHSDITSSDPIQLDIQTSCWEVISCVAKYRKHYPPKEIFPWLTQLIYPKNGTFDVGINHEILQIIFRFFEETAYEKNMQQMYVDCNVLEMCLIYLKHSNLQVVKVFANILHNLSQSDLSMQFFMQERVINELYSRLVCTRAHAITVSMTYILSEILRYALEKQQVAYLLNHNVLKGVSRQLTLENPYLTKHILKTITAYLQHYDVNYVIVQLDECGSLDTIEEMYYDPKYGPIEPILGTILEYAHRIEERNVESQDNEGDIFYF